MSEREQSVGKQTKNKVHSGHRKHIEEDGEREQSVGSRIKPVMRFREHREEDGRENRVESRIKCVMMHTQHIEEVSRDRAECGTEFGNEKKVCDES